MCFRYVRRLATFILHWCPRDIRCQVVWNMIWQQQKRWGGESESRTAIYLLLSSSLYLCCTVQRSFIEYIHHFRVTCIVLAHRFRYWSCANFFTLFKEVVVNVIPWIRQEDTHIFIVERFKIGQQIKEWKKRRTYSMIFYSWTDYLPSILSRQIVAWVLPHFLLHHEELDVLTSKYKKMERIYEWKISSRSVFTFEPRQIYI